MKPRGLSGILCLSFVLSAVAVDGDPGVETDAHAFSWPFLSWEEMRPRGGATIGAGVILATEPKEVWTRIWEDGLTKKERDRRAILALAGSYRVSFNFIETLGFSSDYHPPRPYFSWATEHVTVLEESGDFVSLQHSLVMYFEDEEGEESDAHVMKHWRQDWTWEDPDLLTYRGSRTWERAKSPSPKGRWSQAVFHVDDSPRYQVIGQWTHEGGMSTWRSDDFPRPLPRRESSVRKDYDILEGFHEITLSPTGWIHLQNNRKLRLDPDGTRTYIATEIGVNRYEEVIEPDLTNAWTAYWEKTNDYWQAVRRAWGEVIQVRDRFALRDEVDGKKLFEIHFDRASNIEEAAESDAAADVAHAKETIQRFLKAPTPDPPMRPSPNQPVRFPDNR